MGVQRREFLELIGVATSASALRSVEWVQSEQRTYSNETLELSFKLPEGWRFITRLDYALIRDRYRLPGGEEAKERMLALGGKPLVAIVEELPHREGAVPTIVVWVDDDVSTRPISAPAAHRISYSAYGRELAKFKWVAEPQAGTFAGFDASYCTISYVEVYAGAPAQHVLLKSRLFKRGPHWFTFNFVDSVDGWGPEVEAMFQRFEQTISFT